MTRRGRLSFASAALTAIWMTGGLAAVAAWQSPAATQAGSVAAEASPELVGALSKEIGATPSQTAGAAGTLFGVANTRDATRTRTRDTGHGDTEARTLGVDRVTPDG